MNGSIYPAEVRSSVPYLGPYGTVEALLRSGIVDASTHLPGLPAAPAAGAGAMRERVERAVGDFARRYPSGHVLVSPDALLVDVALETLRVPVSVMLPPHTATEVEAHFRSLRPGRLDVQRLPSLPVPQGRLPGLVLLGSVGPTTSYLTDEDQFLLDMFTSRTIGISVLIDPGDEPGDVVPRWVGVWTSQFTGTYTPAAAEGSAT